MGITRESYERRLREAIPHGPESACICEGCTACAGHVIGCTCDIDWEQAQAAYEDYAPVRAEYMR